MHGENLLVDDSRNRQAVEAVRKSFPQFDVVPPLAFDKAIELAQIKKLNIEQMHVHSS